MRLIELQEWGKPKSVTLSDEELRAVLQFGSKLSVKIGRNGSMSIGPAEGFVGLAKLSKDTQVVVRPKVPVVQLLELIALAYQGRQLPRTSGSALYAQSTAEQWLPFLFAVELERLFSLGLRRGYVDVTENLNCVRGRINFSSSLRRAYDSTNLVCEYSDFTIDTIENRFIRGIVELMLTTRLNPDIRRRLETATEFMVGVGAIRPGIATIPNVDSNPLLQLYKPVIELGKLYLSGAGIEMEAGSIAAPSFFVPMHEIFERAVVNTMARRLGNSRVLYQQRFSDRIVRDAGSPNLSITLIPDAVVLGSSLRAVVRRGDVPLLVLDAKYKNPLRNNRGAAVLRNNDIYQIVSYCKALSCPGVLLYPKVDQDVDVSYRLDDIRFRMLAVDLAKPDVTGIESAIGAICEAVA